MRLPKLLIILLTVALLVWAVEALYLKQRNTSAAARIKAEEAQNRDRLLVEHKQTRRELELEYDKKKQLATGQTVFDRIFNTQDQNIEELILRVSREALPAAWSCDVRVEEFTHFILYIHLPHNPQRATPDQVVVYLHPILKYCGGYLSDVAVFDSTHKSYLFFDKSMLEAIKKDAGISRALARRSEQLGEVFTRFNSVTIECEKHESQLFLPLEVVGSNGVVTCYALFDTGASTTMLSSEVVNKTGIDNLQSAPRRSFNTANGLLSCPIVTREVNVAGFRKGIEVAVNQRDELNLLGMNFFEGMDYIVDFQNSAIYVWQK